MKQSVYAVAFAYYIGTGRVISKEAVSSILGRAYFVVLTTVDTLPSDRICLTTEEYLHGLISMINELPRLAIHAVTTGDFEAPERIASVVKQVHAAFQILNLKNDALRKRFDSLKYDVKRIEEIVYDVRLRGLTGTKQASDLAVFVSDADANAVYHKFAQGM